MANEITLPVKLQIENLQSITRDMKSQLSTLKVDSTGYRNLSKVIQDIEKRIESLQVQSSRPFVNAKQFTDVEKEMSHIQDDLTKIGLEAGKIKFSDLQLDASQKAKLQEFDSQIKSLNDQLKNMKESAKNTFLETDVGKMWKDAHPEAVTQSFEQITKAINKEVQNQQKALEQAKQAYEDYKNTIAASKSINTFMSKKQGHQLSEVSMGKELYNQIFSGEGDKLRFKNGGRSLLQEWLEQQFKFDSSTAQKLVSGTAKEVKAAFEQVQGEVENTLKQQKIRLGERADDARTQSNNGRTYTQDITEKDARMQALQQTQNGLVQSNMAMRKSEQEVQNQLEQAKGAREQYTQSLVSGARGYLTMGEASSAAKQQLASLQQTVDIGKQKLANLDKSVSKLQGISNFVNRYVGAYAIIRKISTAIRNAFTNIKELDKVITNIAVVTNMSQSDLWNKVGEYTQIAQQYGVMTKDVYTVSQLFYQQGLQTSQVMELTTETLKMAKIAGMDYTAATNAMTVAVRAFNIEMSEAQQVTDTYSALAAKFAVSSAEIANAMEKTASSAASVGMSLQSTSAFISVMEQTTRESAQNIGSALKSIISRYGEMKASPDKLLNVEGEDVAFNKTDTALKSIGISIKDVNGQFRDFDDVIMELASKWNTLDNNTQRYIATIMAGNRQQSRFIALVSNYDELKRAMSTANDSENASIVQVGKTLDSLESKTNQLKNAWQQLYLSLHIENGLKGTYDMLTRILQTIGKLGMKNGVLPTLMNLVGFGTGIKNLVKIGQDVINAKKLKVNAETDQAKEDIKQITDEIEKKRTMPITTKVDDTELKNVEQRVQALNVTTTTVGPTGSTMPISDNQFYSILHNAYQNGSLQTQAGRAQTLQEMGVQPGTEKYTEMDKLMTTFDGLQPSVDALKAAFDATTGSVVAHTTAETADSTALIAHTGDVDSNAAATQGETNAKQAGQFSQETFTQTTEQTTVAVGVLGDGAQQTETGLITTSQGIQVLGTEASTTGNNLIPLNSNVSNTNTGMIIAQRTIQTTSQQTRIAGNDIKTLGDQARNTAGALPGAAGGGTGNNPPGGKTGWFNSQNTGLMRGIGIGASLSRIGGTALAAYGAQLQDTSEGNIETSKLVTGLGNGLSMAGTGASMGAAAGPWGAVIGGVAGLLIGGLGSVLDALNFTIAEKIDLARQEAETLKNESLKAQAKVIDTKSSIDNIKQLQKAMYNSTEDMKAYKDAMNTLAQEYPDLISSYDDSGNAIINLSDAERKLTELRIESAQAAREASIAETKQNQLELMGYQDISKIIQEQSMVNKDKSDKYTEGIMADIGEVAASGLTALGGPLGTLWWTGKSYSESGDIHGLTDAERVVAALLGGVSSSTNKNTIDTVAKDNGELVPILSKTNYSAGNLLGDFLVGSIDYAGIIEAYARESAEYSDKMKNGTNNLTYEDYRNIATILRDNRELSNRYSQGYKTGAGGSVANQAEWQYYLDTSDIDVGYTYNVDEINEKLKEYTNLFGKEMTVMSLLGKKVEDTISAEELTKINDIINNKIKQQNKKIVNSRKQASMSTAEETLLDIASDELNVTDSTTLGDHKVYSKLFYRMMEQQKGSYDDIYDWYDQNHRTYTEVAKETSAQLITWFKSLSNSAREFLYSIDYTEYLNIDDIAQRLNLKEGTEEYQAILAEFIENNEANKTRILETIYETGKYGERKGLNQSLRGLEKIDPYQDVLVEDAESNGKILQRTKGKAMQIADLIGNNEIISKYADYFTTQLLDINNIAEEGYSQLATGRLNNLYTLVNQLSNINDSKIQSELYGIITKIDFSDYDSLLSAQEKVVEYRKKYGESNEYTAQLLGIGGTLWNAMNDLVFNINTLSQTVVDSVSSAAKEVNNIIGSAKSGFDISKAFEALEKLNISRGSDNRLSFNQAFNYDAIEGKYIYSIDGIKAAMAQNKEHLEREVDKLTTTAGFFEKYTKVSGRTNKTFNGYDFDNDDNDPTGILKETVNYDKWTQAEKTLYENLAIQFLESTDYITHTWKDWEDFLSKQNENAQEMKTYAKEFHETYNKNEYQQYFQNIDWSKIALGTDYTGINKFSASLMVDALNEQFKLGLDQFTGENWEEILDATLNQIYQGNQEGINAAKAQIKESIDSENISRLNTALSEVLGANINGFISNATQEVLKQHNIFDISGIKESIDLGINAAIEILNTLEKELYTSSLTLEQYNSSAKQILSARHNYQSPKIALDFLSNTIDDSALESLANNLGIELTNIVDVTTGNIKGEIGNYLSYNAVTNTYDITGTLDEFVDALHREFNLEIEKTSQEYIQILKNRNDTILKKEHEVDQAVTEELEKLASAKSGDRLNLAQTFTLFNSDTWEKLLAGFNATMVDGILTISNAANIPAIIDRISAAVVDAGQMLPDELAKLNDALKSALSSITNILKNGIAGNLSYSDKNTLEQWASNYGIEGLDFTETKDGFKLAQDSAIELYDQLKLIDGLQAQLVFDELNKSLQESNVHYKSMSDIISRIKTLEAIPSDVRSEQYERELALAKEIYAVRSTTEDASFSFMSNKIPAAQNNPINYFNDWAGAINNFNEAVKNPGSYTKNGKTQESGFLDYSDWYNMVTEMNNIAKLGGDIEFAGHTLDGSLEAAAKLIEAGADSLVATDTGEIKVALSGMSLDFESGADAFSGGVTEGIQAMAHSQVEMLDGMIQLMETIVAMESLGDIDIDGDGIQLGDIVDILFQTDGDSKKVTGVKYQLTERYQEWLDALDVKLENDKDLKDAMENVKVGDKNLVQIAHQTAEEFTEADAAILNAFYEAAKSGDYDLDNVMESIREVLAGTDYSGTISFGDQTLVIDKGVTVIQTKEGKFKAPDGKEFDNQDDAINYSVLLKLGVDRDTIILNPKEGIKAQGTIIFGDTEFTIKQDSEDNITYNAHGITASSLEDYIEQYIQRAERGSAQINLDQLRFDLSVQYGLTPLDSFTYQGLSKDIKEQLETALASGKQTEVDAVISANPVLNSLSGKTGQQIIEQLGMDDLTVTVSNTEAIEAIKTVEDALNQLKDKTIYITTVKKEITLKDSGNKAPKTPDISPDLPHKINATGNLGYAKSQGTLMGELGPELVVSNGRYFVVGQNGPEMIDLADDAIVFNHLQTKSLLEKGMSSGRGKAVTSERNAVSFATGNVNGGPAMADASSALAALKQLRAQWKALESLSVTDLAKKGGGGGGGGGDDKAFLKELEKWYNWLQKIARLEKEINLEEAKRSKYQSDFTRSGQDYYISQVNTLEKLQDQAAVTKSLRDSKQGWFDQRRAQMNDQGNPFTALYTFDEYGQLKYKDGALSKLSYIWGTNDKGEANLSAQQQYEAILAMDKRFADFMQFDSSGQAIDQNDYAAMVQAFADKMDSDKESMQSEWDDIQDLDKSLLELETNRNELLHAIEDNQITLENKVLSAIVESRQRAIDDAKKERDAIEEASNNLTNGLRNALDKERTMYENQQNADELATLQRRLGILQRSGGSASEIANLQQQITEKQQDTYFDLQEQQIDAIEQASEAELERLDNQIEIMQSTLDYEKEHGLLWNQVYQELTKSPEEISAFIQQNTSEYWGKSPTELNKVLTSDMFIIDQFKAMQSEAAKSIIGEGYDSLDDLIKHYSDEAVEAKAAEETAQANAAAEASAAAAEGAGANTTSTETSGNENKDNKQYRAYYDIIDGSTNNPISGYSGYGIGKTKDEAISVANSKATAKIKALADKHITGASVKMGKVVAFDIGGMVDQTGPAYLHAKEGVLTAAQTSVLRNDILGNKPNSALSILSDLRNQWIKMEQAQYTPATQSTGITIENATVEMNVAQIANDYDARRAGEQALSEMMRIARKTAAQNRIG